MLNDAPARAASRPPAIIHTFQWCVEPSVSHLRAGAQQPTQHPVHAEQSVTAVIKRQTVARAPYLRTKRDSR